jgi:hypothetical protein
MLGIFQPWSGLPSRANWLLDLRMLMKYSTPCTVTQRSAQPSPLPLSIAVPSSFTEVKNAHLGCQSEGLVIPVGWQHPSHDAVPLV